MFLNTSLRWILEKSACHVEIICLMVFVKAYDISTIRKCAAFAPSSLKIANAQLDLPINLLKSKAKQNSPT